MSSRFGRGVLGVALFAAACGSGQTPTAPSTTLGAAPAGVGRVLSDPANSDVSSPLEMRALAGRFTNALTGAAAAGVTLTVDGVGAVAGDAAGQFNLESEAPDGRYRVTASGAGVVSRVTTLTFPGQAPVVSLIPSTFNMTAFDQMARQFGEPAGVTKRWAVPPALVIETSFVDAQSVVGGMPQFPPRRIGGAAVGGVY